MSTCLCILINFHIKKSLVHTCETHISSSIRFLGPNLEIVLSPHRTQFHLARCLARSKHGCDLNTAPNWLFNDYRDCGATLRFGGSPLLTRYWGGGGTRHFFLLTLYNFKKYWVGRGSTCSALPSTPLLPVPWIKIGDRAYRWHAL